ncbi:hypothetical protein [Hafnia alvei]|uniref:hypothetical protein n=1 Tax=Hafnia alvei TaxID=569 RepID=UPI001413112A|nr:hypothetical protein [Hafnia alvei]QIP56818.1 hypothetical protein HBA19_14880 [Hafnia alvei]
MPKNDFKAFAIGENSNVLTQAEFDSLDAVATGFQSGIARSEQLNKVWRQSSVITHVLARFVAEKSGDDVLDDGDLDKLTNSLVKALFNNSKTQLDKRYLNIDKNLEDLSNASDARKNIDVYSKKEARDTLLEKDKNGSDVIDRDLFVKNVGAARAYSGSVHIGGNSEVWTTAQFISWLDGQKAFNHPYWMCKGSWTYANNKVITDTGCGNICLAGAVIEVMGIRNAMTIRVTTPSTTSGGGIPNAEFIYINHGDQYSPGWRRDFNTRNKPTAADTNALPITGGYLTGNVGFNNDSTLGWERYTDWAKMGFKNDSDGDTDAYMWFETGDNGNEYFKWRHKHSGGTTNDWMTLKSDALRVAGQVIPTNYANFDARYLSPSNAYSKTESDARYVRDVRLGTNITNVIWGSGGGTCPKGHVLTGGNFDDDREYPIFAPIQKYINNTWYTVSQL